MVIINNSLKKQRFSSILNICISLILCFTAAIYANWIEDFAELNEDNYHLGRDSYWNEDDGNYVITEAQNGQIGRIFNLNEMPNAIFFAEFDFRIGGGGGGGADGLVFAWVRDYEYEQTGGGSLNFDGADGYGIELDTYRGGTDPSEEHVGIIFETVNNHLETWVADDGEIEDNEWHHVRVVNILGHVTVFLDDEEVIDHEIENYEPFDGYFGFAAATGGASNWHIIDNVEVLIGGPELSIESNQVEFGPSPVDQQFEIGFLISNLAEVDDEWHVLNFTLTDLGEDPDWLDFNAAEGEVEPGGQLEINFIANTDGLELGEYDREVILTTNDPHNPEVVIRVHIFVVDGFGQLTGIVTDAANDRVIEGAQVAIEEFQMFELTDENGLYHFEDIPAWSYNLIITKEDFLPMVVIDVEIEADQEVERDFALLHSEFEISPNRIEVLINPDDEIDHSMTIRNIGNGALNWRVVRNFPEGMEAEIWEIRDEIFIADSVDNNRIGGVEFVDDHFYVAGGFREEANQIYVLDREGNLQRQFEQFSESSYGMRDLAFGDGLLWGTDENICYGFTLDGELATEFEIPFNAPRNLAWDSQQNLLWMCHTTSDIHAMSTDGEVIIEMDRPDANLRIYGLAFYADDPDEYNLYAFCRPQGMPRQLNKINTETGEVILCFEEGFGANAAAATITNRWDPYSWVFLGMTDGGDDRLIIQHIEAPTGWLQVNQEQGEVEARGEQEIEVTLDAPGLQLNVEFNADLTFTHNGVGGEAEVPVVLTVTEGPGHAIRDIDLAFGWNMISTYVDPDCTDVVFLTEQLVADEILMMIKDGFGRFYNPAYEYNNIPAWNVYEGYLVKTSAASTLRIEGTTVVSDEPLDLVEGWQMISYFPRIPVEATIALSGLGDNLIIAKDGAGNFYVPEWEYSNMGNMMAGKGYQVKLNEDTQLIYRLRIEEEEVAEELHTKEFENKRLLPLHPVTSVNMSLLVVSDPTLQGEIGVYSSDELVGSGLLINGKAGIAVWGDDPTTESIDGAIEGASISLKVVRNELVKEIQYTVISGKCVYSSNGLTLVEINESGISTEFGLGSSFPNPFNNKTVIKFGLASRNEVVVDLFDISGRKIDQIVKGNLVAGKHQFVIDGATLSSGLYIVRLNAGDRVSTLKIALLK